MYQVLFFSPFEFHVLAIQSTDNQHEVETPVSNDQQLSESNNIEISSEFQISVTRTNFDTSSPSDDATMQDISSDTDSVESSEPEQRLENRDRMEELKGNSSNIDEIF